MHDQERSTEETFMNASISQPSNGTITVFKAFKSN